MRDHLKLLYVCSRVDNAIKLKSLGYINGQKGLTMSTSFQVYPTVPDIPKFTDFIKQTEKNFRAYLVKMDLDIRPKIEYQFMCIPNKSERVTQLPLPEFFIDYSKETYDTYVYYSTSVDKKGRGIIDCREMYKDHWGDNDVYIPEGFCDSGLDELFFKNYKLKRYWHFLRNAGQSATMNALYGIAAASLAQLTNSFIISDDGAWDYKNFPALPDDFLEWYFVPEKTENESLRNWAEECIKLMANERYSQLP